MLSDQVPRLPITGRSTDWTAWTQMPSRPALARPTSAEPFGPPASTVCMTAPMPCGAATVLELRVKGTLVSERFAARAPCTIAVAMAPIATVAGRARNTDLRQR